MNTAELRSQCLAQTAYSFGDGPPAWTGGRDKAAAGWTATAPHYYCPRGCLTAIDQTKWLAEAASL